MDVKDRVVVVTGGLVARRRPPIRTCAVLPAARGTPSL